MNKKNIIIILKGFIIGSSMSVPGVSGGTIAILLGIYEDLISSISHFTKDIKKNLFFLLKFLVGSMVGIATLARLIELMLERFPLPVSFLFLGAVIGGIPALYKKAKEETFKISSVIYFLVGLGVVVSISFLPTKTISISSGSGLLHYLMLFVVGIIIAIALILPGISTSHMLLVLGMLEATYEAINSFDITYIAILVISTLVGIILITKPLEWVMKKFPHQTYCVVIGFVVGSTYAVFKDIVVPSIPKGETPLWWGLTIIVTIIAFILGIIGIMSLSKISND